MDVSTIVNIILSVLSFLLALLSIIFVWLTLRQNNKILNSESRPYVVAYMIYEEYSQHFIFCVKNFGRTSAIINYINISPEIKIYKKTCNDIFINTMIAPMQQIHFHIADKHCIINNELFNYNVEVEYIDVTNNNVYQESYTMNLEYVNEVLVTEHRKTNYSNTENALRNLERSISAIKDKIL